MLIALDRLERVTGIYIVDMGLLDWGISVTAMRSELRDPSRLPVLEPARDSAREPPLLGGGSWLLVGLSASLTVTLISGWSSSENSLASSLEGRGEKLGGEVMDGLGSSTLTLPSIIMKNLSPIDSAVTIAHSLYSKTTSPALNSSSRRHSQMSRRSASRMSRSWKNLISLMIMASRW